MTDFDVTIETTVRTLTINERFSNTLNTATLVAQSTPCANKITNFLATPGLTCKSIQGHISFAALSGRTLGGQATYFTMPAATPTVYSGAATPFAVEPEHRIAFAISPDEISKTGQSSSLLLADAFIKRIRQGLYEHGLYKH